MDEPPTPHVQDDPEATLRQLRSPNPEELQLQLEFSVAIQHSEIESAVAYPSVSQENDVQLTSNSPITNDEITASPPILNRGTSKVTDLISDEEEDLFPSHEEILSRPVIKQEPSTPTQNKRKDSIKTEMTSPSQDDTDDLDDDLYLYEKPDSDDEDAFDGEADPLFVPGSKKRKGQGKSTGPRARTAREYHARKNAKIPPEKKRGLSWKREQLEKLREKIAASVQGKKQKKTSTRNLKGNFDPSVFLNGTSSRKGSRKASRGFRTKSGIRTNKKQGFIDLFLARYPHLDLHRCKTDWRDLSKKSASFGYGRMQKDDDGWRLKGMETCRFKLCDLIC